MRKGREKKSHKLLQITVVESASTFDATKRYLFADKCTQVSYSTLCANVHCTLPWVGRVADRRKHAPTTINHFALGKETHRTCRKAINLSCGVDCHLRTGVTLWGGPKRSSVCHMVTCADFSPDPTFHQTPTNYYVVGTYSGIFGPCGTPPTSRALPLGLRDEERASQISTIALKASTTSTNIALFERRTRGRIFFQNFSFTRYSSTGPSNSQTLVYGEA